MLLWLIGDIEVLEELLDRHVVRHGAPLHEQVQQKLHLNQLFAPFHDYTNAQFL
jgi:hypothetical protein